MDPHSLKLLEFDRVCALIAARAEAPLARAALTAAAPIADPARRALETSRLAEALRRAREPGAWCAVGRESLVEPLDPASRDPLDGPALVAVREWLDAARETREAWPEGGIRERFPELVRLLEDLPELEPLRVRLAASLEPDGSLRDDASPALRRARAGVQDGERRLHAQLERWASGFGGDSYVTRFGDRFVACIPAAGFSRRRGIVHDTSNSGQSLFVEPLEACEANNHLLELRASAFEEERRILRELAAAVAAAREPVLETERLLSALDALRACGRWAAELDGIALAPEPGPLRLVRARHPLLALSERAESVVPLDLELAEDGRLLLVSGPNMGGKTVLLKTVGLAVALAHSALPVPAAEGSRVPPLEALLADLGDEQSVDQGLSTFAGHLQRLRAMAEAAGPATLVLADELGAGTDPEEGAALGRALIEHFARARTWGIVTTHLGSLKRVAAEISGVVNGSLEFDLETLTPLYRFLPGVPGASHALAVAARMGLPPQVVERARSLTPQETRALERLLADVAEALRAANQERAALAGARAQAEAAALAHREASEEARRSLAELRRRLTAESDALLTRARELWQTIQREAKRADKSRADAEGLRRGLAEVEQAGEALVRRAAPAALGLPEDAPAAGGPPRIAIGARVRVRDLGIEAEIASLPDAEGRVRLRRGNWNIQSSVDRLAAAEPPGAPVPRAGASFTPAEERAPLEVDLRGMEVDEALQSVDQGLDRAVVAGLSELRIIHGIGRGVLRSAVARHLKGHSQVESQRLGEGHEGGRGVTVARLR